MTNERNTAVITYIDEFYIENLKNDFVVSLFTSAAYKGTLVILDYTEDNQLKDFSYGDHDIRVISCKKDFAVFSQRYRDIPKAIEGLDEKITNIMLADGGDIWFQKSITPIFESTEKRIGCVEEIQLIGEDSWTEKCIANLSPRNIEKFMLVCNHTHVKNSGMIAGPREMVKKIIEDVYSDICDEGVNFFGIDQLFFNYRFNLLSDTAKRVLDNENNFVLVTNKKGFFEKNGLIYRNDGKLVTLVHNAGGAWRVLERPYKNPCVNYDQYIVENVVAIGI